MSFPKKVFLLFVIIGLAMGINIGITKMISPESASVSLNGEQVEGMKALVVSAVLGMIPGAIIGIFAAGFTSLFIRHRRKDK